MALSKKNSRIIKVKNEPFRCVFSPADSGYVVLVAKHNEIKGSRINVYIETDINDFWINFPNVKNMNLRVIKPKDVAVIITEAIEQGWDSKKSGKSIIFDLKEKLLIKRE